VRWALLFPLSLSTLVACGGDQPVPESMAQALQSGNAELALLTQPPDAAPAPPPMPVLVVPPAEPASRRRLELSLRSTPSGAAASLDGRLVGTTPMSLEVADDNRAHEFTFVLPGHEPWKLRFAPIKDGVIHATLRPRPGDVPDARAR
jgi:hypothetical protein